MNVFFAMTYSLITVGLVALVWAEIISWPIFLLMALLTACSPFRTRLGLNFSRQAINVVVLIFAVVLLLNLLYLGGAAVDQLLYFSLSLLVAKLYGPKAYRDHLQIFLISAFYLVAATLKLATLGYLLLLLIFLGVGIAYLIILNMRRDHEWCREVLDDRTAKPATSPSASEYLLPADIRRILARSFHFKLFVCFIGVIFISTAIFYVIPRFTFRIISGRAQSTELNTGFSQQINLGELGELMQNDSPVMRVYVEKDPPETRVGLRWRGITLDRFDGSSWSVSEEIQDEDQYLFSTNYMSNHDYRFGLSEPVNTEQVLELQPLDTRMIFLPANPHSVTLSPFSKSSVFPPGNIKSVRYNFFTGNYSFSMVEKYEYVEFRKVINERYSDESEGWRYFRNAWARKEKETWKEPLKYRVRAHVKSPDESVLRRLAEDDDPESIRKFYLQMPAGMQRIGEFARQVVAGQTNRYDRAEAIETYLRTQFSYTLMPAPVEGGMSLESFLFDIKRGHCEYFSAAMAVMLRSLDIPTRVVNGFVAGEFNSFGDYYQVRQSDAHSWVEVYFPGSGWVPFDPTPPHADRGWHPLRTLRQLFDAAQSGWVKHVVDFGFQEQRKLFGGMFSRIAPDNRFRGMAFDLASGNPRGKSVVASAVALLGGAGLLGFGFYYLLASPSTVEQKRRQAAKAKSRDVRSAIEFYQQFLRIMSRKGLSLQPGQTPGEFLEVLKIKAPDLSESAQRITTIYYSIRFGEAPLSPQTRQDLTELLKYLRQVK